MVKHILLQKAFIFEPAKEIPKPADCSYNNANGYWQIDSTGEVMITSRTILEGLVSKKADIETGEDQKGE
ncbi:MAG: hypothetical protein PHN64_02260 [Desulfovibrionaceae bacterium]|nr:hypothetical protein [Desulfovibrionaceae bacterium]